MPILASLLPLTIPMPLAKGAPAEGYPCEWGVYRWLEGETADIELLADPSHAAINLARFLAALQRIDTAGGPPAGPPNTSRGMPLHTRDAQTRRAIAELNDEVDVEAVTGAWEEALRAPEWQRPPVGIHGDLIPGNMLVHEGRLSAILDFAALCVGDPATDAMVAWTFLTAETRPLFRAELGIDDATWARGRGWALSWALIALPYYLQTYSFIVRDARRTIAEILVDI
jgi:aminoglycoside phosphotransferase (APT) family kinase protein